MWPLRIHLRRQGLEGRAQGQDIAVKVIPKDKLCVLHLGSPLLNFGALLDYESLNQLGLVIGVYVSWVQIMRNIVRF
ncbi:uncharacterized protein [Triticum aestivum]|uniref:uncharacterized protein isoform X2 n=1 Tax=Triticum aestivum TaxID=4565 RepID=UPI001D00645F|nr:uncharacterized protein LOC123113710 isoform X2 [Triticum aestivum]